MGDVLRFMILGIGTGSIVAALALGLVVIYRSSGVINFGYGAMAAWIAYTFNSLQVDGDIPIPPLPNPAAPIEALFSVEILDLPTHVSLGASLGFAPAAVASIAVASVLGLLAHLLVFRPLRFAPVLAKVVASIGIMLFLQAAIVLRFGSRPQVIEPALPNDTVSWFGAAIPVDRYLLLGIVAVLTIGMMSLYRFTRFGLATRAAAENERFAALLGINADKQAGANWIIASILAGIMGILASPIIGLTPNQLTLLVIPALGAALLGGMTSFWIAASAGLGIGMAQSGLFFAEQEYDWIPDLNLPQALPFVMIAVAMVLRGEALPSRGSIVAARLPEAAAPKLVLWRLLSYSVLVVSTALVLVFAPFEFRAGMNNTLIGVILALSLVVSTGFVGQISLMQMSLAGVAGFAVASFGLDAGIPFPLDVLLAVAAATGIGLAAAVPSLRTRGASLAIITLASGIAIDEFLLKREGWFGSADTRDVRQPDLFGIRLDPNADFFFGDGKIPSPTFGLVLLAAAIVAAAMVMRVRRSRLGEQMLAVRANERAAAAAGVNVRVVKMSSYAIGSALAGLAGCLTAWKLGQFGSESFSLFASLTLLAFAYLGGITTVGGAVMAGILFTEGIGVVATEQIFHLELGRYTAYVAGLALIATAIYNPDGIDGFQRQQFYRVVSRFGSRHRGVVAPDLPEGST